MISLLSLWQPILLAAFIVFVASSIIHMTPLWHRNDYPEMPREDEVLKALQPLAIPPGDYFLPRPGGREQMRSAEFQAKLAKGPVAVMTVMPNGMMNMTRSLTQWFIFLVVVSVFTAYVTSRALGAGAPYPRVFQLAGATAFMGYALALCQFSIWFRRSWTLTLKGCFDGLIYASLTAGTFGWLWPR
jgi:hypothetical protein